MFLSCVIAILFMSMGANSSCTASEIWKLQKGTALCKCDGSADCTANQYCDVSDGSKSCTTQPAACVLTGTNSANVNGGTACGCGSDNTASASGTVAVCKTTEFCTSTGTQLATGGVVVNSTGIYQPAGSGKCMTIPTASCKRMVNPPAAGCICHGAAPKRYCARDSNYCSVDHSSSNNATTNDCIPMSLCSTSAGMLTNTTGTGVPTTTAPCVCNTGTTKVICGIEEYCNSTPGSSAICLPIQCESMKVLDSTAKRCWCANSIASGLGSSAVGTISSSNNCGGGITGSTKKYCGDNLGNVSGVNCITAESNGCTSNVKNCDSCDTYAHICTTCSTGNIWSWDSTNNVITCTTATASSVATMASAFVLMSSILFY